MNTETTLEKTEVKATKSNVSPRNIDGFFRAKTMPSTRQVAAKKQIVTPKTDRNVNHAHAHAPQVAKTTKVRVASEKAMHYSIPVQHHASLANHVKHHTTQSSQTLMRRAVARPRPSLRKQASAAGVLQHTVPSLIQHTPSIGVVHPTKLVHAQSVSKNPLVSHHGANAQSPFTAQFASIPVQVAPQPQPSNKPSVTKPNDKEPSNIFEQAMANAENYVDLHAHKKSYKKHRRNHALSMSTGFAALLLITAFAFYQNTPGVQFKVASVRAGVATHMPNFAAAGFAYNGVKNQNGKLVVGFNGTHGNGNYRLVQQTTNMSPDDMINSVGATDARGYPSYKTVQAGQTTVYRFDNVGATWVNNGTWYTVSGSTPLSNDQVAKLAENV